MTTRVTGCFVASALVAALAVPASATPPGQNGLLVWAREGGGLPNVWVANPDGSAQRRLFAKKGSAGLEGTFSPTDADLMFFTRFTEKPFSDDIYRGSLATGEVARVIGGRSADLAPTVSPDGTKIAFFSVPRPKRIREDVPPPPERIKVANIDGSDARALTPKNRRSIDPDWSPDGTRLVYTEARIAGDDVSLRLMLMNADGSGRRVLTRFGGVDEINAKWMPDGQSIVFEQLRDRNPRSDIASITPDGCDVRVILSTKAWETNPVPSPDGTRIVFTSDRDRRGRERLNPGFELYTMAVDGSDIVRVTNNRQLDLFPDWQRLP
jgi:Tol biopolymer transport system component